MLFKDSVIIDARADEVWQYLASPDLWNLFHAKAGRCEQISPQGGRVGSLYAMDFRMGDRTTTTQCEIIDLQFGHTIQVRSTLTESDCCGCFALLTYTLEDLGSKTKVLERCEMTTPNMGIFVRVIVWLISRFGHPTGVTTLMKLKEIVEK